MDKGQVRKMRDLAYVYRDLCAAHDRLEAAETDAEFLSAQAKFEQIEAEWIDLGSSLGLIEEERHRFGEGLRQIEEGPGRIEPA